MRLRKSLAVLVATLATTLTFAQCDDEYEDPPVNWGVLLFPTFEALDVFGPLEALNLLSLTVPLNLSLISRTLDPVSTKPRAMTTPSNFSESILPTHTFSNPPPDLEVLLVPGGLGTRAPDLQAEVGFIRDTYPQLKYLITVCTGAWLAANAGVLDGRNATTNKKAWAGRPVNNSVNWITHARWVVDDNIWTSSGVSAGIDATLAFVEEIYGEELATDVANSMEYERHTNATWDPFAELYGLA
ncbi:hypothetical protein PLEOSDRAFT_1035376 [Pleurotus ostreatus PC15]|uniref:DJ-1/PfpI domain-containing protein n=1 Tax=Pleurotus ostreatus (strain PC15) TaxID=1137138 RepID=A0A067NUR1_PLEO1|nr:hypothetical protein PLEOSDRAFT_1035376 [Pleurotus ostreatus PC15]